MRYSDSSYNGELFRSEYMQQPYNRYERETYDYDKKIYEFKNTFEHLLYDIQSFIISKRENIQRIPYIIEKICNSYNNVEKDYIFIYFMGLEKTSSNKNFYNYNFYLKSFDHDISGLRIIITGFIFNKEYNMSLALNNEILEHNPYF
jgi:uncharacterized protein YeeX (DUF496 family)